MPNWCWNHLTISSSDNDENGIKQFRAKLLFMVEDMESSPEVWGGAFDYLVGRADDYDEVNGWYDHNIREYGSKWQKSAKDFIESLEDDGETITISFDSAWSPVTEFSKKLSKQYRLNIEHTFDEQGDWFAGRLIVDDGEVEEEFCDTYYKGTYKIDSCDFWEQLTNNMECWFDDIDEADDYYQSTLKELKTFLSTEELAQFNKDYNEALDTARIEQEMIEASGLENWKNYEVAGEEMLFIGCQNRKFAFRKPDYTQVYFDELPADIKRLETNLK